MARSTLLATLTLRSVAMVSQDDGWAVAEGDVNLKSVEKWPASPPRR